MEQEQGTGSQEWPFALVNTSIPGAVDAVDGVDMVDAVAAVVRGVWPLNNNYSIPYTAVQQYSSTAVQQRQQYSSLSHHTRRAVVGGLVAIIAISRLSLQKRIGGEGRGDEERGEAIGPIL